MRIASVLLFSFVAVSPIPRPMSRPSSSIGDNRPDEPKIKQFSLDKGFEFLDRAAVEWTQKRECFSCHTNFAFYLYSLANRLGEEPGS